MGGNCRLLMDSFSLFMYMLGKIIVLVLGTALYYMTKTFIDMVTLRTLGWEISLDVPDGLNIITRLFISQRHQT